MDYSYLAERVDSFITLIDLINSYKFVVSSEEVKNSILKVAQIVCSVDGNIHEYEKDLLNTLFDKQLTVEDYENQKPSKAEIKAFRDLTPSLMQKLSFKFDDVVDEVVKTDYPISNMYHDLVVDVMKTCMVADGIVDYREREFIESYDDCMKKYIEKVK